MGFVAGRAGVRAIGVGAACWRSPSSAPRGAQAERRCRSHGRRSSAGTAGRGQHAAAPSGGRWAEPANPRPTTWAVVALPGTRADDASARYRRATAIAYPRRTAGTLLQALRAADANQLAHERPYIGLGDARAPSAATPAPTAGPDADARPDAPRLTPVATADPDARRPRPRRPRRPATPVAVPARRRGPAGERGTADHPPVPGRAHARRADAHGAASPFLGPRPAAATITIRCRAQLPAQALVAPAQRKSTLTRMGRFERSLPAGMKITVSGDPQGLHRQAHDVHDPPRQAPLRTDRACPQGAASRSVRRAYDRPSGRRRARRRRRPRVRGRRSRPLAAATRLRRRAVRREHGRAAPASATEVPTLATIAVRRRLSQRGGAARAGLPAHRAGKRRGRRPAQEAAAPAGSATATARPRDARTRRAPVAPTRPRRPGHAGPTPAPPRHSRQRPARPSTPTADERPPGPRAVRGRVGCRGSLAASPSRSSAAAGGLVRGHRIAADPVAPAVEPAQVLDAGPARAEGLAGWARGAHGSPALPGARRRARLDALRGADDDRCRSRCVPARTPSLVPAALRRRTPTARLLGARDRRRVVGLQARGPTRAASPATPCSTSTRSRPRAGC